MPLTVAMRLVRRCHFQEDAMRTLVRYPPPTLPGHILVLESLSAGRKLNTASSELFHRARHIGRSEAQMMNMFAELLEALAERRSRSRLDQLNFAAVMGDECDPSHALIGTAGKIFVFDDRLRAL